MKYLVINYTNDDPIVEVYSKEEALTSATLMRGDDVRIFGVAEEYVLEKITKLVPVSPNPINI